MSCSRSRVGSWTYTVRRCTNLDEGDGPVFLCLHGNPTWSFLYRHIVAGLRDRFRCVALDHPGFGLSTAAAGYRYTVAEHARAVERFVEQLGLRDVTMMVQDWVGPIGFWVATHHPEWFRAFVIGNTWAWPINDLNTRLFSTTLGSQTLGGLLVKNADIFVNLFMKVGIKRKKPALITWADKGPGLQTGPALPMGKHLPQSPDPHLHGASHFIQEDAPDEILEAITDWSPTTKPDGLR